MTYLGTNWDAPLPLAYSQAIGRAVELREMGLNWPTIQFVMCEYHGLDRAESTWRRALRGRVKPMPRGNPYVSNKAAA